MCGITGIYAFTSKGAECFHKLSSSVYSLHQRGPDGEGLYHDKNVVLGHRRLSIIDTSTAAAQPFTDASGRYTIVFNGEIFNFHELRKKLIEKGILFKSQSDTEVLLYSFIQYGPECLKELNGEFAFAIYDKTKGSLLLARDRYGIKPLYVYQDEDKLMFASELKALLALGIPRDISQEALSFYFHLNYIPAPYSIFKNTTKMEAGTYMEIIVGSYRTQHYYHLPYIEKTEKINYENAKQKLFDLLDDSVKKRMIADVPLGTFLSGGIDSSLVTAIAARYNNQLNTFSIGYKDEPFFDETRYAQLVAKQWKTNHTVFQLGNEDLYQHLNTMLDYLDEPFADSSALPMYILSKYTRKHVKVALSGDGADELFGGYNKHRAEWLVQNNGMIAGLKYLEPLLSVLPKSRNAGFSNKIRQLQKLNKGAQQSVAERYWQWAGFSNDKILLQQLSNVRYEEIKSFYLNPVKNNMNAVLLTDVLLVLQNDMLVKVDRMSMANSLEVRVPFLDHRLVDFVFSLPAEYKIDKHQQKKIIKDTFQSYLPNEVLNRKKQGFEVPLLKWFKTELKSIITDDLLNDQFIEQQNIFKVDEVKKLKQQLFSNSPDDSVAKVWSLIVFQHWWKKTIV